MFTGGGEKAGGGNVTLLEHGYRVAMGYRAEKS